MSLRSACFRALRSGPIGLLVALTLSLVLASQAVGGTWHTRVALTKSKDAEAAGLVTIGSSTAVVLFNDGSGLSIRRSTNSGVTWKPRQNIADSGWYNAIAGSGTDVDIVWMDEDPGTGNVLRYRRSVDSGATFAASLDLATGNYNEDYFSPNVARLGSVVAVAWEDYEQSLVRIRVSTDGGASFGSTTDLAIESKVTGARPAVAVGNGVIYAVYFIDATHVDMRRSLDNGTTWTSAIELAADASPYDNTDAISLTASGTHAYLAYAATSGTSKWVRYRRTINKGATWTSAVDLSSPSGAGSYHPYIFLKSNVVRVVYFECTVSNCARNGAVVRYRQSSNGKTWTAPETVSTSGPIWADPYGVGYAGRVIVLYSAQHGTNPYTCACDVYIRTK